MRKKRGIAGLLMLLGAVTGFYFLLPDPLFTPSYSLVLTDSQGQLLQARIAQDGQWRFPPAAEVPDKFRQALLAYEDRHFYYHPGFDPLALGRAVYQNLRAGEVVSGGSTLTMQTIRLSRGKERSYFQKALEMLMAVRLECGYSKDGILALYASHAPFGGNVVGLDAAAWRYFGRSPETLSWGEAACLAVLPNSPALIHPGRNRSRLLEKRNRLLDRLCAQGLISSDQCLLAKAEPIPEKPHPVPQFAPHLLARVDAEGKQRVEGRQVVVKTTIDAGLQARVAAVIDQHHRHLSANGINNAAAMVMEIGSGNVLAYVGNVYRPEDPELESHVDIISAPRSPGSTLKPLLYAAMLSDGLILPGSLLPDVPTQIAGYTPQNFDLQFDGAVPANKALARSLNVPAVKMLQTYRTERFYSLLKRLGSTTLNRPPAHYGLSLILGGGESSMWELAGMYSSLARMLIHYPQYSSRYFQGDIRMPNYLAGYKPPAPKPGEQLSPATFLGAGAIFHTFNSMDELMRPGDELLWSQFGSSQKIAWKTGTSFGFRDGWAIGLTSKHLVVVWCGNADGEGRPGLTGISTAAPVLFEIFKTLPAAPWFAPPYDDLAEIAVCKKSGFRAGEYCGLADTLKVPESGLYARTCPYHQIVHLDKSRQYRVTSDCETPSEMQNVAWFVLPPAMEWYYKQKNADYHTLPPMMEGCMERQQLQTMEMIYPRRQNKIHVPVEIDGKTGKCVFEAAHRRPGTRIFWHLDNRFVAVTKDFHQLALSPDPGRHTLVLTDELGERLEQPFEILARKPESGP